MVKFAATKEEMQLIGLIADRYLIKHPGLGPKQDVMMDVEATHCNGCRLRLRDFAAADDFNFFHDIYGIRRHLNRETGQLEDFFLPRYSA